MFEETITRRSLATGIGFGVLALASAGTLGACASTNDEAEGASEIARVVDEIASKEEIRRQIQNYARAMDRGDAELGYSIAWDDAYFDYGETFQGSCKDFVDWSCEYHGSSTLCTSHQMTADIIEIEGDRAVSETRCIADLMLDTDPVSIVSSRVRYCDRWERREGQWKLTYRMSINDMYNTTIVMPEAGGPGMGKRFDFTDPSYDFLGTLE